MPNPLSIIRSGKKWNHSLQAFIPFHIMKMFETMFLVNVTRSIAKPFFLFTVYKHIKNTLPHVFHYNFVYKHLAKIFFNCCAKRK